MNDDNKSDDDISIKEEEAMMNDGEDDDDDDDGQGKLNSSGTSLDKYVGKGRNSKYMTLLPRRF